VNYLFRETCSVDRALAVAGQFSSQHDSAAGFLLLSSPAETWLDDPADAVLVPDLPIFKVNFGWARQAYPELWKYNTRFIAVTLADLSAGLVVDHYYGVLEDEINDEELVYEVACWG
jgi:hypothetical protein